MLACPNCGAAARSDAVACTHCRVQLQTVACPRCFGMGFRGARHCSHCGARTFAPPESGDSVGPRRCPRCAPHPRELAVTAVGEAFLEECGRCGGLWVDLDSFQRIVSRKEKSAAFVGLGSPLPQPGHAAAPDRVRYVVCPVCGKMMNRVNFARCSGVVVDVCKRHGTWFDADELRQILAFIESGGLDAAHERELERMRRENERLREERRELERSQVHAVFADVDERSNVLDAASELLHWILK